MADQLAKKVVKKSKKVQLSKGKRVQFNIGGKTAVMLDWIVDEHEMGGRAEAVRMLIREYYKAMNKKHVTDKDS